MKRKTILPIAAFLMILSGAFARDSYCQDPAGKVTLHLKNKSAISGNLVRETPDKVTIEWKGGDVGFNRSEIERIEYGKTTEEKEGPLFPEEKKEWPYRHEVVIQLNNLTVLDAEIAKVGPEKIIIRYPVEGGGSIEQEIERARVENLLFKPVENRETKIVEANLRKQFSEMRFYQESIFTIVTDSDSEWVKRYKKVLRAHVKDFYLTYFKLLKGRKSRIQNFVVIFDDMFDYWDYALTDGVPVPGAAGYFYAVDKVLYLPNYLGRDMEDWIQEVALGTVRKKVGYIEDQIKERIDKRYHIFIDGLTDEIKGKFVKIVNFTKAHHRAMTYNVLKHEATHELFHNWGLQTIIMSRVKLSHEDLAAKKKEYLETDWNDAEKKEELLKKIWKQRRDALESYEAEASNSWFKEGTATYSETDPIGEVNNEWLYVYQDAKRKKLLQPLEQLTVYEIGSFSGVASEAKYASYGQSWALTHFLMSNYPDQFMVYLERIATKEPEGNEDLTWLLEALGKGLREIDEEFLKYMDRFEEAEYPDFEVKLYDLIYETFY